MSFTGILSKVRGTKYFFVLLLLIVGCSDDPVNQSSTDPLARSAQWLWDQQAEDGGWHSEKYGFLKGGETWTAFTMYALSLVPDSAYSPAPEKVDKALDFIVSNVKPNGALGVGDSMVIEYPNYATAYGYRVLKKYDRAQDREVMLKMEVYLAGEQYEDSRGIGDTSLVYGAWGFGELGLEDGEYGYVDISHTRRVMEARRESGNFEPPSQELAKMFLRVCQKNPKDSRMQPLVRDFTKKIPFDGGFYYSPVILAANKGKIDDGNDSIAQHFKSYATATCDGVLAWLATSEIPGECEELDAGIEWLKNHPQLDPPPGLPEDELEPWYLAMHYYHLMVRAEVYKKLDWDRSEIEKMLVAEQKGDGHFENAMSPLMKEDDPILATAMSIIALASCR